MLECITFLFQGNSLVFLSFISLLGLFIGSFLNVAIYRIPIMLERQWASVSQQQSGESITLHQNRFNLFLPRSHCPHCKKTLSALLMIPLLSYVFLGAKSACCKQPISWRYPAIEALTMALSLLVAFRFGASWQCLAALGFTWALIALAFIDLEHKILPDHITLPLLWTGLLVNTTHLFASSESALWGAVAGYALFWSVAFAYKHFRDVDGLGQGDFKLLAACGAWLGWQLLPFTILFSSLLGAIIGSVFLFALKRDAHESIPFGPFIAIAAFVALLCGHTIMGY